MREFGTRHEVPNEGEVFAFKLSGRSRDGGSGNWNSYGIEWTICETFQYQFGFLSWDKFQIRGQYEWASKRHFGQKGQRLSLLCWGACHVGELILLWGVPVGRWHVLKPHPPRRRSSLSESPCCCDHCHQSSLSLSWTRPPL